MGIETMNDSLQTRSTNGNITTVKKNTFKSQ